MPTNNNFKENFNANFSEEELKEAICNTKVKKTAWTRQYLSRIYSQPRPKSNEDTHNDL